MKKFLILIFVVLVIYALPVTALAQGETETAALLEEESGADAGTADEEFSIVAKKIEGWLLDHFEEISVVITLIVFVIKNISSIKKQDKSIGTLNNNAVNIAESASENMANALAEMKHASGAVTKYDESISALLEAFNQTANDKAMLERELIEIKNYLAISTRSNIEFANELADLLALANIPNFKKEEIGARHLAAVNKIIEAEAKAEEEADRAAKMLLPKRGEEVNSDVEEETKA